jgi:hypothetical protein
MSISLRLYSPCGHWPLFQFLNLYTVGTTFGRGISPSQGLYLYTEQHKQRIKHTDIHELGFEPTISVFERAKTVHALDGAATVIGSFPDVFILKMV